MAFSYDEPVRYNEGKVDWTLLPWDDIVLNDLVMSLNYYNLSSPEKLQEFIVERLITKDVDHILTISLLLQQGDVGAREYVNWNLPWDALEQVCRVFQHGVEKYSRDNYKIAPGLPLENYIQSMWRHTVSYLKGEENDIDSGLPNLAHLACNAFMYLWTQKTYHEPNTEDTSVSRQ